MSTTIANVSSETTYSLVADSYSYRARNGISPALRQKIAISLGYNPKDTSKIPEEANIGEGCGNPLAIAGLVEGEKVVDLGCGGGFDVFQASRKVGTTGKVFGVDMTEDMISLAKRNAEKMGATNVEFIHCNINKLPFADGSMDCVISNCVLNLVPEGDKLEVLREIHRVLRPCGRLAVSDFLALKPLSAEIKADTDLQAGCVSGAMEVGKMENYLHALGFDDLLLVDAKKDLNLYKDGETAKSVTPCCAAGSSCKPGITDSGRKVLDYDLNEWISSFQIYGHKWCGKTKQTAPQVASVALQGEAAPITTVTTACGPLTDCC